MLLHVFVRSLCFMWCSQITERVLQRLLITTGDVHVKVCLGESLARQHKLDDALLQFKEVRYSVSRFII